MASTTTAVLHYHDYGYRESQRVRQTRHFCGACRRGIGGVGGSACFGYPEYPEQVEAKNDGPMFDPGSWRRAERRELEYYAFCPWCGSEFEDEWWRERTIQNERAIDHYQNPGTHKGDTHQFRGEGPDCMTGHYLGTTDLNSVCWCDPEIEPGLMGCVIRHRDIRYEDYLASRPKPAEWADDPDT